MQLAAYVILITVDRSVHPHDYAENLLRDHFCCLMAAHGPVNTLAICEDVVSLDEAKRPVFKQYQKFLKSKHARGAIVNIQEHGELSDVPRFMTNLGHAAQLGIIELALN
jgi:hypothetical protein